MGPVRRLPTATPGADRAIIFSASQNLFHKSLRNDDELFIKISGVGATAYSACNRNCNDAHNTGTAF